MAASLGQNVGSGAAAGGTIGSAAGPVGTAVGAGVGALAGLIGYLIESGHQEEADKILKRARDAYGSLDDSAVQKAAAEVLGPTNLAAISADPRYRAMQDQALAQLGSLSRSGLSLSDRANLADASMEMGQRARADRESIGQSFRARGLGGSGMEFAAQLQQQQSGANQASANARRVAGDAQDRALRALSAFGAMAGGLETRDYNRQADRANAQDSIDRFNNSEGYRRANDAYGRQVDTLDRNYRLAADAAGREIAQGQRQGQVVGGVGNAVGNTITRASNAGTGEPPKQTVTYAPKSDTSGYETLYAQPGDED